MSKNIVLNKINFSRAVKSLTKQLKNMSSDLKNNQVSDLLAKSFGFSSYHHAEKNDFMLVADPNKKMFVCKVVFSPYRGGGPDYSKVIICKNCQKEDIDLFAISTRIGLENLALQSREAIEKFDVVVNDCLIGSGHLEDGDYVIGDFLGTFYYSDVIADMMGSYPDAKSELNNVLKVEFEKNGQFDVPEEFIIKKIEVSEISEEEYNLMEKLDLIDHIIS